MKIGLLVKSAGELTENSLLPELQEELFCWLDSCVCCPRAHTTSLTGGSQSGK